MSKTKRTVKPRAAPAKPLVAGGSWGSAKVFAEGPVLAVVAILAVLGLVTTSVALAVAQARALSRPDTADHRSALGELSKARSLPVTVPASGRLDLRIEAAVPSAVDAVRRYTVRIE